METFTIDLAGAVLEVAMHDGLPVARWRSSQGPTDRSLRRRAQMQPWMADFGALVGAWRSGQRPNSRLICAWLPSDPPFFAACWRAAIRIPRGTTRSYAWLAKEAGRPRAARAAALAMARNPLPLLVPCHRVIGSHDQGGFCGRAHSHDGRSTNWALALKDRLIALESRRGEDSYTSAPRRISRLVIRNSK